MHTMSINSKDFAFESHYICQHLDVSNIDMHAMALHSVLDLVDDRLSGCLNAQHLLHLENVVGLSFFEVDTWSRHHLLKASTLD